MYLGAARRSPPLRFCSPRFLEERRKSPRHLISFPSVKPLEDRPPRLWRPGAVMIKLRAICAGTAVRSTRPLRLRAEQIVHVHRQLPRQAVAALQQLVQPVLCVGDAVKQPVVAQAERCVLQRELEHCAVKEDICQTDGRS